MDGDTSSSPRRRVMAYADRSKRRRLTGQHVAQQDETPRLALSRRDAPAALGVSLRHFQRHVQPHLRCIYSGQLRLYPVAELERWMNDQGAPETVLSAVSGAGSLRF
jgi:hypothetical protein